MATPAAPSELAPAGRAASGRDRVHASALRLFAEFGVSGTSLQMIADDMGVTKAALYYHYKTKDDLVLGVIRPLLERVSLTVEAARRLRSRRAQVEFVLDGLVDVILDARRTYVLATNDRFVGHLLERDGELVQTGERLVDLLAGPDPTAVDRLRTILFLSGLTGPLSDPECTAMPEDEFRATVVDTGRRLLLVRRT